MTLKEWQEKYNRPVHGTPGSKYVVATGEARIALYALDDYYVSLSSGMFVWLAPKRKP